MNKTVDIGNRKQIFADDFIIAERHNLERTMGQPKKYPGNPIMAPRYPWEGGYLSPDQVLFDDGIFKMWYRGLDFTAKEVHRPNYAISADGVHFEAQILGLVEFENSKENSILPGRCGPVIRDDYDVLPERRYKRVGTQKGPDVAIWFSPDGIHWRDCGNNPVLTSTGDTHTLLGWDELQEKYVGYFRPSGLPRRIGRSTSEDFVHWTEIETVIAPDVHDAVGTQFYKMRPFFDQEAKAYFGLLHVLHLDAVEKDFRQPDPEGWEQTVDVQLVFSWDGINFMRMGNRQPFLPLGLYESWDDMQIWTGMPILVKEEIRIYYSGVNVRHQFPELNLSGQRKDGRWRGGQIGLTTLRVDGWVSLNANREEGMLLTKPFIFTGKRLMVNADASAGDLRVAVLDESQNPVLKRTVEASQPITSDATMHTVTWAGEDDLSEFQGKPVRLRFHLRNCHLFSFQFK